MIAFVFRLWSSVFLLLTLSLSSVAAIAQTPPPMLGGPARENAITPRLIAESAQPSPGSKVTLAMAMAVKPGWHGYWEATGDAGLPMTVDWTLTGKGGAGVTIGAPSYPLPMRLSIAGLMNYVFKGDYAVLYDVAVPTSAKPGDSLTITGTARWLACTDEICVPEQDEVTLTLTVGDGQVEPATREMFDGWRARLPRPLDQPALFARSGKTVSIAVPFPEGAAISEPSFFPLTEGAVVHAAAQTIRRVGNMIVVSVEGGADWSGNRIDGVVKIGPQTGLRISAVPGAIPDGGTIIAGPQLGGASATDWQAFLIALGGAMLGGLILNIMPCVFPILSLKALSLAKAGSGQGDVRAEGIAYTAGVMLMCLALGALMLALRAAGNEIGWAFQLQDPRVVALLLVLMTAIAANLAGFFELGSVGIGDGLARAGGRTGAFWTGVLAAFVATPCAGPFMAAAIGAALILPPVLALTVFAGLGLGLALPFLIIGLSARARAMLPKPGPWMAKIRVILAVPMALTALALVWLLSRQMGASGWILGATLLGLTLLALLWFGKRQRIGAKLAGPAVALSLLLGGIAVAAPSLVPKSAAVADTGTDVPFSEAALANARRQNKPVFLYFTADWCLTCKANEAAAINRDAVREAFERHGMIVMVGDWTRNDPAITRFLASQGRSGVPLYLCYPAGATVPTVLPQTLTPDTLIALTTGR